MSNTQKFNVELIKASRQQAFDQLVRELKAMRDEELTQAGNMVHTRAVHMEAADALTDTVELVKAALARLGVAV